MNMILFVLHDSEKLQAVLSAWEDTGVGGVTVFKSTGIGRIRLEQGLRDDMPLMPGLEDFFPNPESLGRTIFTVVPDNEMVEKVIQATEDVVGDLDEPNTGLLVVLPTAQVRGLNKNGR